jgi:hypothetical protein
LTHLKKTHKNAPREAPERKPRPGTLKQIIPEISSCHLEGYFEPDGDRRTKRKSDPGKVALM